MNSLASPAIDTETLALNPAKRSALLVAQNRADRENAEIRVYVARATTREPYTGDRAKGFNVYFARSADEGEPMDSQLFRVAKPSVKVADLKQDAHGNRVNPNWGQLQAGETVVSDFIRESGSLKLRPFPFAPRVGEPDRTSCPLGGSLTAELCFPVGVIS